MKTHSLAVDTPVGYHTLAVDIYRPRGKIQDKTPIVIGPGLIQTAAVYGKLAKAFADNGRVAVVYDPIGRGKSDDLRTDLESGTHYGYGLYVPHGQAVIQHAMALTQSPKVDYFGTSMGGIVGMMIGVKQNNPLRKILFNDIGSFIPKESFANLAYVGQATSFKSQKEVETYIRSIYKAFGMIGDEWAYYAQNCTRRKPDGSLEMGYDVRIGKAIQAATTDVDLRPFWAALTSPDLMVFRGETSTFLSKETADDMQKAQPTTQIVVWKGIGHAPAMQNSEQIETAVRFFNARRVNRSFTQG